MKMSSRLRKNRRAAYTLIEVLVAVAIIAILAGLIMAGVMYVWNKGPETMARVELGNFDNGLGAARKELGSDFLPSTFVLREDNAYNFNDPVYGTAYRNTVNALNRAFGRNWMSTPWIDWNGNGTKETVPLVLQGHHALVFWTGGIPGPGGKSLLGFSPDPTNPALAPKANEIRRGPWMVFKPERLVQDPSNHFPYYVDPFIHSPGTPQPYVYFSTQSTANSYTNDCSNVVGAAFVPYKTSANQYAAPNGYQIISAGLDGVWGPGGLLPATDKPGGVDNLANFKTGRLSTP